MKNFFLIIIINFIIFNTSNSEWITVNSGTNYLLTSIQVINTTSVYVCGEDPNFQASKFFKSTNLGLNWVETNFGNSVYAVGDLYFVNSQTGFISAFSGFGKLLQTYDGGINWSFITSQSSLGAINFPNDSVGYFESVSAPGSQTYEQIHKTTNSGISWSIVAQGPINWWEAIGQMWFTNEQTGYSLRGQSIGKTTNGGISWVTLLADLPNVPQRITFSDSLNGIVVGRAGMIFRTTNAGINWLAMTTGTTYSFYGMDFASHDTLYIVGVQGAIFKSTDAGISYSHQISGTYEDLSQVSFVNSTTGFVCAHNGVILKTTNGGNPIAVQPVSNEVPNSFSLYQNYPNPFNPATSIKFAVPHKAVVAITIYNVLGEEITKLVNEEFSPGTFETSWDASNYPSGVYYYKLTVNSEQLTKYTETKRMVLIK